MQADADPLPLAQLTPYASGFPVGKAKWSIFAFILSALHHSRSAQARRFLRQNEHLIDRLKERIP